MRQRQGAPGPADRRATTPTRRGSSPVSPAVADERADDRPGCWPTPTPRRANASPARTPATRVPPPASSSAVTSHSDRRHGRSPRRTADTRRPTCTATTTRRARCAGRAWAPPTAPSCSPCSTCTGPGSAGCSPRPPTGARRAGQRRRAVAVAGLQPHRGAGRGLARLHQRRPRGDGVRPSTRASSTTRTPIAVGPGKVSRWRHADRRAPNRLRAVGGCDCVIP